MNVFAHTRGGRSSLRAGQAAVVRNRQWRRAFGIAVASVIALAAAGCATASEGGTDSVSVQTPNAVTLIVHDSFPAGDFEAAASAATGFDVTVLTAGDGGELTNKLVLTKGAPIADVFFGVDNAFASRLIEHDVTPELVPIDFGATCVNIDPAWFVDHGIEAPVTYEDLTNPRYRGLTVVLDPTGSSTGASFLIGTVAAFGEDGFAEYWRDLLANDVRVEQGWGEAYNGQFTEGGGDGTFPIVVSYSSSPAWTVSEDGESSSTVALLDTCSSQVEYAGLLTGATNPEGASAVIDYLLSSEFQNTIADTMYMYPIDPDATVPEEWQRFAPAPSNPHDLTPEAIGEGLERWLRVWAEVAGV